MNAAWRVRGILSNPSVEWSRIENESGDWAYLLTGYVALLAAIPAVSGFIGACFIGAMVPGSGVVRSPLLEGFFGAVFGFVATCAIVVVLGVLINLLAPRFGARRDFGSAFKLAVYSYTPVWLAGVFLLAPGLRFLTLTAFYGVYVLWRGLPQLMKAPAANVPGYAAVIVGFAGVITLLAAGAQHALFGLGVF